MDDFMKSKSLAESWLQTNSSKFRILSVDKEEKRFVFGVPETQISFIVICPVSKGESWSVWSDEEKVLHQLEHVMDYLDGRENLTIDTVLDRITSALAKQVDTVSQVVSRSSTSPKPPNDQENDEDDSFEDAMDDDDEEADGCADDFDYYDGEDLDAREEEIKEDEEDDDLMTFFKASGDKAQPPTIKRLCSDMRSLAKTGEKYGFSAGPEGNNLFKWKVRLLDIPADCKLGRDLKHYAHRTKQEAVIQMEMQFPNDYPYSPPFLRVIRPRFKFLTGHVTIGGSICMEMLTKSGWLPTNDIESILVQVRTEILSDPNASLDSSNWDTPYTELEARDAFNRMVLRYGWNK